MRKFALPEAADGSRGGMICFDQFAIDLDRGSLREGSNEVWLRPKSLAVLRYLAENAGRLILKDEIFAALWPDAPVTDDSLVQCIGEVRRALGDRYRRFVRTIPRKGYLFDAEVSCSRLNREPVNFSLETPRPCLALAKLDRPSIEITPFRRLSHNPEHECFADGIVEEIVTKVSHTRWLLVMAGNLRISRKDSTIDVKHISHDFGVSYILKGCVRNAAGLVRVTTQLVDASNGTYLWAERYDRNLDDVFAVLDEISASITGAVISAIERNERERVTRKMAASLSAWECYNRGLWHYANAEATENALALKFFERAVEFDAGFVAAHAAMARTLATEVTRFRPPTIRPAFISRATAHARRSIALDPADAAGHGALALTLLHMGQHDEAMAEADVAVHLNPNSALPYGYQGASRAFGGRPRDAAQPLETAMRLSPFDPLRSDWLHYRARASYWMHDYPAAVTAARQLCQSYPSFRPAYGVLMAGLGQMGQTKEARRVMSEAIKRFGNQYPAYLATKTREFRTGDHQHLIEGRRMAGVLEQ